METQLKPSNTDTAVKVIGAIFGTAHFIFQTAADLTAEAEGRLVQKVTKSEITKEQCVDNRKKSTELKQLQALEKLRAIREKAQNMKSNQTKESHA